MRKFCTCLCLIFTVALNAQDRLDKAINLLENNYSQEKIYIQTDKDKYIAGDQIWFKVFAFDGYRRSGISGTVFVEIYDRNKKLIDSRPVPLLDGEGQGSIKLKPDLTEDIYYLRAVTPYMNNFPREFDFVKALPVYNTQSSDKLERAADKNWTIKAVSEGSTFIQDRENKVSVRMLSNGNPPEKWSGYVTEISQPQSRIVSFNQLDANVATFTFTPKANTTYRLHVQDNSGISREIDMPKSMSSGVQLKVKNQQDGTQYTLSAINLPNGLLNYKVIGTIGNRLAYRANIKKESQEVKVIIPSKINEGQAGILQLTVFNADDVRVADRLVFVNPQRNGFQSSLVKPNTINTGARAKNSVQIIFPGASTAVLVKNADAEVSEMENSDLLSTLWLTGDIKSVVHMPSQYFGQGAKSDALDALLVSEKWTRFTWDSLLKGQTPKNTNATNRFLSYEGRLAINSRPLPNQRIMLMSKAEGGELAFTPLTTDKDGKVYLNNVYIDEPLDISFFLEGQKRDEKTPENLTLNFQMVKPGTFTGTLPATPYRLVPRPAGEKLNTEIAQAIIQQKNEEQIYSDVQLIEEVKLRAQKKDLTKKLDNQLSTGMFRTGSAVVFDMVNDNQNAGATGNIMDWLQGRAAGLMIERSQGVSYPVIRGTPAKIFLDEFPSDADAIATVPMSAVALVKVVKTGSAVGEAVLIYTKRGNMGGGNPTSSQLKRIQLTGYDQPASPDALNLTSTAQSRLKQDVREVLYWNPQHTSAKVDFLNSDVASAIRIIAAGFDEKGNILYYEGVHGK